MKKVMHNLYQTLPHDLTQYIDCKRRRKHWRTQEIVFVHVPKAAGTSVSHAVYGRSLGHFKASEIKRWCPKEFENLFKFAFVRNPWDRAVSAYRFAIKGGTEVAGIRKSRQYQIPELRSFEAFVYEWLAEHNLSELDNVFQPQYLFVADENDKLMVDYLGKVEQLEHDMRKISNITEKGLEVLELNQVGGRGEYMKYYQDSQLIDAVGKLYAKDVALFGYDFK